MRQFRESKSLKRAGLKRKKQGLIYYTLINGLQTEKVTELCKSIGGTKWKGLKAFLTREDVNDTYVRVKYGIRSEDLYKMRNEFYLQWAQLMNI